MIPNTHTDLRLVTMNPPIEAHAIAGWTEGGAPLIVGAYTLEIPQGPYFISDRSRRATKEEIGEGMRHLRVFREVDE